ncbi:MAG: DUF2851 family protein [Bacteroidia bacterium]|nr:DUF2851 family protein [Bacteroidia bacterium]MDW8089143.1 DUF2851 family protein [Bacteroidia bacterium]
MARNVSELFLHWVWKKQLYPREELFTVQGQPLKVIRPGLPDHQGPDFTQAEIVLNGLRWHGAVEIDITSDLWYAHRHHENPAYRSVILYVVWRLRGQTLPVDVDGRQIPVFCLEGRVSPSLWTQWKEQRAFPCAPIARLVPQSLWAEVYDQWGEYRLRQRHQLYRTQPEFLQGFWEALGYSYGVPYYGASFRRIAQALPWPMLVRRAETLLEKEAALLGTAGLLEGRPSPEEAYERELLAAWEAQRRKFGWVPLPLRWKASRPAVSPWVRLSALANLLQSYPTLFALLESFPTSLPPPSSYWQAHWAWQRPFKRAQRRLPPLLERNAYLNALYPFAIYYWRTKGNLEKAVEITAAFRQLAPENHWYARLYARHSYPARSAWQTQGQIALWRAACSAQQCLNCKIGKALLRL